VKVKGVRRARALWTCPKCGLKFVGRKMWHSCGFVDVREIVPHWWVHRMWITDAKQLDAQVQRWIARSYRTTGTHGLTKVKR